MNPETQARGELARPDVEPKGLVPASQPARVIPVPQGGPIGQPKAPPAAISSISLLRALRRRSALALGVALLAAGVTGPASWFLLPRSFKAQARLHVAAQPPKVLFQTVETQNPAADDYRRYQSTQQTLVKSQLVLAAALRDPKISGYRTIREQIDPIEWLQEKLRVDFVAGSEVMEISLVGSQPEEVAGLVNAVKQAYMDEVVNRDLKRRVERFDRLRKLKDNYADLLRTRRETMRKLAESVGSNDRETLALRQQYAMEHLHYLQKELIELQSQRRKIETNLGAMQPGKAGEREPPSERELDRLVDQHPAVVEVTEMLAKRQEQLETEKANLQRISRNPAAEPSDRVLGSAVDGLRQLRARRCKEVRPEVMSQFQSKNSAQDDSKGRTLGRELAMLADLERRLEAEIKSISVVNTSLTVNTLDLQAHQEEVAQMGEAASKVAQEVEALNVELEAPPRIRPIDEATVPRTGNDKKRLTMVGMVTFGSFFGGLIGIAFLELQARKVDTAADVLAELGLAIVGVLPILPARNHSGGAIARRVTGKDRYWRDILQESIDATRTLLLHAARTGQYRVMMITSAVGGEGKTSLASYLATSLTQSGLRTLLIDADLRRPSMHRIFDQPLAPGLSELLRGEADVDEAPGATGVEGLMLLAGGRCDRQALRCLSQGGLAPLFDRLKQRFDFIIVDTSPILPVADALQVAQHTDAAIFSIFRDVSRKTQVKAAFERLQRLGVPVVGAVMTGDHGASYGNQYYGSDYAYTGLPESVAVPPDPAS